MSMDDVIIAATAVMEVDDGTAVAAIVACSQRLVLVLVFPCLLLISVNADKEVDVAVF